MIKSRLLSAVSACMLVLFTSSSNAALVSALGGQAVYDSDLNITWTADMRLAISNTFGTSGINASFGKMTWSTANTWISNMNAANYLGFNDWRLPTFANPDSSCTNDTAGTTPSSGPDGYNCTGSELGHLFYTEFGAGAGTFLSATGNSTELAKFTNNLDASYWGPLKGSLAYSFSFGNGNPGGLQLDSTTLIGNLNVIAVRSGNVSAVPVPAAVWLFGSGLIGLIGMAKRKKA